LVKMEHILKPNDQQKKPMALNAMRNARMKVLKSKGAVSTKAESFVKTEHLKAFKQEGVARGLVKPLIKKEGRFKVNEGALRLVKKRSTPAHVATGRLRHFLVYAGRREKTSGGLKKEDIGRNKRGRYVSLKQSAHGHRFYKKTIRSWNVAFQGARTQLNCNGFVAINGGTLMGQALYCRMKKLNVKEGADAEQNVKSEPHSAKSHVKSEPHSATADPAAKSEVHPATATPTKTANPTKVQAKSELLSATATPTKGQVKSEPHSESADPTKAQFKSELHSESADPMQGQFKSELNLAD